MLMHCCLKRHCMKKNRAMDDAIRARDAMISLAETIYNDRMMQAANLYTAAYYKAYPKEQEDV